MAHIRVTSGYTASNSLGELIISNNSSGNTTLTFGGTGTGTAIATSNCAIAINAGESVTFAGGGTLTVNNTPNPSIR